MSDFPPSWDWFSEHHASGKATNIPGPYDDNFTFKWPVLNKSQSMVHPQSMHQGLRQMPPVLKHGNVQNSTYNATVSGFTPDPSEAFREPQALGETRAASFGRIRNEINSVRLTGSLAGQQNVEVSGTNHEKQSPQQEGIQWNDMYLESNNIVEFALPDLLYQPVLDTSSFDNTLYFDHNFGLHSNGGGDGNVSSHAEGPDPYPKGEAVNQSFDASFTVDLSDGSECAILLQSVASPALATANRDSKKHPSYHCQRITVSDLWVAALPGLTELLNWESPFTEQNTGTILHLPRDHLTM
jgi:hypothetical protein